MYILEKITTRLANLLNLTLNQVESTITLLDEGATVPFIARYRKEVTGSLTDTQLRELVEKLTYLRELDERRETILNSIKEQNKLTAEVEEQILKADNKTTLEYLYLPYKPKRRTKAQIAKEAGLEPLALVILNDMSLDYSSVANDFLNSDKNINTTTDALDGAKFIIMDIFAENITVISKIRNKLLNEGLLTTNVIEAKEELGEKFKDYFNYSELLKTAPSHRILACFRGYKEKFLTLKITYPEQETLSRNDISSYEQIIIDEFNISLTHKWLLDTVKLCFKAKIFTSIENELLNMLRETAEAEAIKVFANNLRNLLLQAPAGNKNTMGLDPGIRTGVKVAIMDKTSQVINTTTIYPFQPKNEYSKSILTLAELIRKYDIELIAIGNGTASRETEKLVKDLLTKFNDIKTTSVVVSEAGASVYSASEYASQELPELDVSLRGAVSIGRRLQDPLAELVKIDPKSIGVGQYQHDVNQVKLSQSLNNIVEDCVNSVGIDVNTASIPLLTKVAGLNTIIAGNIVNYRNQNGRFNNREELKNVPRLGARTYEQCAGFLRIYHGNNKLDESSVHPESYSLIDNICTKAGLNVNELINNNAIINKLNPRDFVTDTYGIPTITDIFAELEKPGRDPRGTFKTAQFKDNVNEIDDLLVGMELEGVITNVTNFGAFIDIGVHQDGLVHVSEITDKFIKNPNEVIKAGQIVTVRVIEVDKKRRRISLTMKGLNKINIVGGGGNNNNISMRNNNKSNIPQTAFAEAFKKLRN